MGQRAPPLQARTNKVTKMTKHNDAAWYGDTFKTWQGSLLGGKPGNDLLHTVHMLGLRPGKQALANAMALRPQGVTGSEIVIACGAPQLNRMRGLISDGLVKRVPHTARNGHTVYKLELTPKGAKRVTVTEARVATAAAAGDAQQADKPAKPAKAKRVRKPAKPATVPVQAPAQGGDMPGDTGTVITQPAAPQA